ncbi:MULTISPECIES: PhzF family phenazine biosynthesis protein [Clostridium]|uniref:PhzF family phenazine biosynthesis protein n=1 Tax=Clostridium TaxID=1485 RepID=UPI000825C56D|nr:MULTISPECIES: PhzF family phenazine biosynthesis protein [Clostridium]PJI08203.1 PhzF family phenazine biosynthesis protein [Clostridium sp. CT7]
MKLKVYTVNAFAKSPNGGNPAGVVMNADTLSENDMKKISKIIGFSETAFVMKSNCADFKVRFFTPNSEVDLCGHATIGTYHTLLSEGYIKPGNYSQETKAGILNISINKDTLIMMNQTIPNFYHIIPKEEIADSLNLTLNEIEETLPVQIVSTGLKDILVPIKNMKILDSMKPNFKKIEQISRKYNVIGYHAFTLETLYGSNAHCRNFAPLYDIPEESATGTSSGALGCYLYKYGKISLNQCQNIIFEQGYSMKKPSEIIALLNIKNNKIVEVKVGGKALNLASRDLEI